VALPAVACRAIFKLEWGKISNTSKSDRRVLVPEPIATVQLELFVGIAAHHRLPAIYCRLLHKADKDRSGSFLHRKFIIEPHFAGRKSLL
jgi:hypothetical protein